MEWRSPRSLSYFSHSFPGGLENFVTGHACAGRSAMMSIYLFIVDDIIIELWLISERTVQLLNINNAGVLNSVKIECSNILLDKVFILCGRSMMMVKKTLKSNNWLKRYENTKFLAAILLPSAE